ncbi:MAG: CCA tRNA nucleotidyltransferase, partial [bacterium]|nr:CCA tRNA nucleotidyltransferase [bacterium]
MKNLIENIPLKILNALNVLQESGYLSYLVGGCVRDLLLGKTPNDWDITTSALPEQIQIIFEKEGFKTVYENQFGTVLVILGEGKGEKGLEITPFRTESKYSDKRHPDEIKWAKTLEEDLKRRDFTVNAIALTEILNPKSEILNKSQTCLPTGKIQNSKSQTNCQLKVIDLFKGKEDIENKTIRAVGMPEQRFKEDALRLMRAIRFAVCLDKAPWCIEEKTLQAIKQQADDLKFISQERIRDELIKIIESHNPKQGIELLREVGLLKHILPELLEGFGIAQNKHHTFEVYQHNLLALDYASKQKFSFEVKMAALLHDIGKPRTKRGQGKDATFYNHELVSANMAKKALSRLRFSTKQVDKICLLVKSHLFYYNVGEVKDASIRRLVKKVGPENIEELLELRYADRIGSGVPKAEPYKLRHLKYLVEKVSHDPISTKMLKV